MRVRDALEHTNAKETRDAGRQYLPLDRCAAAFELVHLVMIDGERVGNLARNNQVGNKGVALAQRNPARPYEVTEILESPRLAHPADHRSETDRHVSFHR